MYISRRILCKFEECNKVSSKIDMMKKIMIKRTMIEKTMIEKTMIEKIMIKRMFHVGGKL